MVRVNRNDQGLIYRTLDRGAQAIVVPHVDSRADAENVGRRRQVPAARQARACSPSRQGYGVADYLERANDETLLIALIEDIEAWRNLDEILAVDGIGVFFVAPSDFAASMGHIGDIGHPDVQEKIEDALKRIVAAGRTAGTLAMNDNVGRFAEIGVRFLLHRHRAVGRGGRERLQGKCIRRNRRVAVRATCRPRQGASKGGHPCDRFTCNR